VKISEIALNSGSGGVNCQLRLRDARESKGEKNVASII